MSKNKGFSLFERIYDPENIYHAWRKAKRIYDTEKDFISVLHEVVDYEVHLEDKISDLSSRIKNGTYSLSKMRPLWLPKVSEKTESRQNFEFSVEDQVVWLSVINIIGPILDDNMPFWSFGNRLYMPIWKETEKLANENGDRTVAKFGYYSSASPNLYRTWSSSWPLFRRAVSISIKTMAKHNDWSDDEETIMEDYANAPKSIKIQYWDKGYWKHESSESEIYYATVDLSKFYPSIHKKHIFNQEVNKLLRLDSEPREFCLLLDHLIDFQIISEHIQDMNSNDPIIGIDLDTGEYNGIPTGLFVAGFLANMAMLPIDMEVTHILNEERRIGHFRFVDDHVFIAYNFNDLLDWIARYDKIIKSKGYKLQIKPEKTEPEALKNWLCNKTETNSNRTTQELDEEKDKKDTARKACQLDVHMPSPFTTLTLKKMSNINATPFDLMDTQEKMVMLQDIEHLLVTEFPEGEIKKDTRASWAASLLIRLEPQINPFTEILYERRQAYENAAKKLKSLESKKDAESTKETSEYQKALAEKDNKYAQLTDQLEKARKETTRLHRQIFLLIKKAVAENIEKPKIWKKCIEYCRKVGLSPIGELLALINENKQLTKAGKQYLFCTLLSSLCRNIILSIKTHDTTIYSNSETKYAADFVSNTESEFHHLIQADSSYHCFDSDILLQRLQLAIRLYHIERANDTVHDKATPLPLDFLWYYSPVMLTDRKHIPCFMHSVITNSNKYKNETIYKKLLIMFPSTLDPHKNNELLQEVYGVRQQVHVKRGMLTLEQVFIQQRNERTCKNIVFMEWSILKTMERVIDLLKPNPFSFDFSNTDYNYFNCSLFNFYIKKDINTCDTWEKLRNFYANPTVIQKSQSPIRDLRFEGKFYSLSGEDFEKQQVYSCAILLLVLLRGSMDFPPMFARRSQYDRNYQTLLSLLDGLPVSSYTQGILFGAFNENRFDRKKHTALLRSSTGRTEERADAPIIIESMDDLKKEISGALHTLEQYQLSLQNQIPRQLIPISFISLTHQFNPYLPEEQDNETIKR